MNNPTLTTITCIVELGFTINLENLVYFLPVNKGFKKVQDGDIVLVKFRDYKKGIVSSGKRPFRNSITLSIVFEKKLISVKIFRNKFQICGINSDKLINFSIQQVLHHIRNIHNLKLEKNIYTLSFLNNFPEKQNIFHKMREMKNIISGQLDYKVKKVMVNFKYDLQYNISKTNITKILNDILISQRDKTQETRNKYNFFVIYQNTVDFNVYILCKDNKGEFLCYLIVYKSGLITQSGRDQSKMAEVLQEFLEIIEKNKKQIFLNTKRKIMYKAI
jgi:hypothetical protein